MDLSLAGDRIPFKNTSGHTIPAYGVVTLDSFILVEDNTYATVKRHTVYGSQYLAFINGGVDVPNGEFGELQNPSAPVWALYNPSSGTPFTMELWGPIPNSFELNENVGGFIALGNPLVLDTVPLVPVIRNPLTLLLGKTDAAHNKGMNGTVSIWAGSKNSLAVDTGYNLINVWNPLANIAAGKFVWMAPTAFIRATGDTWWDIISAEPVNANLWTAP